MKTDKPKLLAIASIGGHWIQLRRIVAPVEAAGFEPVYISTVEELKPLLKGYGYYTVQDFSRWDVYKIVPMFFKILYIILKEQPAAVITTGAAPGIVALFIARLTGKKTVWIDSIANAQHLSLSGRIASFISSRTYTQWKSLINNKVIYSGNIFG
jgi:UDP-N-acetylglucosamine:LPS N-acetylglucosamine transferase